MKLLTVVLAFFSLAALAVMGQQSSDQGGVVTCAKGYYADHGKCVPKNVGNNDVKTAVPSSTTPGRGPAVEGQSTGINTSRSNVKNNIQVLPGPDGRPHCTFSVAGKAEPCTATEIAQFNAALAKSSAAPGAAKTAVKSIALAKDGSLMCTTSSETGPCTAAHLHDLKQASEVHSNELEPATGAAAPQK
jgi:hypothetical protein